ncbi:MAG: hypothetical protein Q7I94_05575, partial [Candidatus Contubernalis sp.]|nr:hypothetical protein [Candidatus Contubernalis sp.]
HKVTDHYSWIGIARKTVEVYEEVLDYYRQSPWSAENEELYKTMLESLNIQQGKQEEYAVHANRPGLNLRKH